MAEIGTTASSYKKFINAFRAAFGGSQPFTATYNNTSFNYVVVQVQGAVDNLYLTSITNAGGTRQLSAAEVGYGHQAVGQITVQSFIAAAAQNYVAYLDKSKFDVLLLCTVEAARSKWIYTQVNKMITTNVSIDGDDLKTVAQTYGHTQQSIKLVKFRPLSTTDYSSHYKEIALSGTTKAEKFRELFI